MEVSFQRGHCLIALDGVANVEEDLFLLYNVAQSRLELTRDERAESVQKLGGLGIRERGSCRLRYTKIYLVLWTGRYQKEKTHTRVSVVPSLTTVSVRPIDCTTAFADAGSVFTVGRMIAVP